MLKRPQDQRPTGRGAGIMVAKIANGEIEEKLKEPFGRVLSGEAGAKARAKKPTQEERSAIARKATAGRWG
jgi:hypothetical protein